MRSRRQCAVIGPSSRGPRRESMRRTAPLARDFGSIDLLDGDRWSLLHQAAGRRGRGRHQGGAAREATRCAAGRRPDAPLAAGAARSSSTSNASKRSVTARPRDARPGRAISLLNLAEPRPTCLGREPARRDRRGSTGPHARGAGRGGAATRRSRSSPLLPGAATGPYAERPGTEFTLQAATGRHRLLIAGLPERGPVCAGGPHRRVGRGHLRGRRRPLGLAVGAPHRTRDSTSISPSSRRCSCASRSITT